MILHIQLVALVVLSISSVVHCWSMVNHGKA
jgi:hypothetical protein